MIKVKQEFYDLQEGVFRNAGDEFEASEERFEELQAALPDYVEKSDGPDTATDTEAKSGTGKKKAKNDKEVAPADELPI